MTVVIRQRVASSSLCGTDTLVCAGRNARQRHRQECLCHIGRSLLSDTVPRQAAFGGQRGRACSFGRQQRLYLIPLPQGHGAFLLLAVCRRRVGPKIFVSTLRRTSENRSTRLAMATSYRDRDWSADVPVRRWLPVRTIGHTSDRCGRGRPHSYVATLRATTSSITSSATEISSSVV
jgi:hypothetical protein